MLNGKNVVIGVCGGIAAYKVIEVVSRLKKYNANVDVIMTENAKYFVTPLTLQSISQNPVITDMFAQPQSWDIKHISLAEKADIILVAPATANIIGKVAAGIADDMLTTTIMATKATVVFAPAMNCNMYENSIVQNNISKLKELGYVFLEPATGALACGTHGKGRLPEPEEIVEQVLHILNKKSDMSRLKVLITAGPTREAIDPVRFISNRSTGKMGYAIAAAAKSRGADVVMVSGPVVMQRPFGVKVHDVTTAEDMYQKVKDCHAWADIVIFTAAVSDYRCRSISNNKIKKTTDTLTLELIKNPDIAKEMGKQKGNRLHIGFSAETDELLANALSKLKEKNLDLIVANDVTMEGAGFGVDTNIVKIINKEGNILELPKLSKLEVAHWILDETMRMKGRMV
ncbi:MAG: bifunctional phosphopantothenoylcysteine decarboxylase/phosphopantothenate--cysteine ligase CoaBC [Acetivibrionales bacterium]